MIKVKVSRMGSARSSRHLGLSRLQISELGFTLRSPYSTGLARTISSDKQGRTAKLVSTLVVYIPRLYEVENDLP